MQSAQLVIPVNEQDHSLGPSNAPVTLVEYGDFECPHCRRAHPIVHGIRRYMGDQLRFVYRHFPLVEAHPHAEMAAEAAEAAGLQGRFWEMHDILFLNQHALEPDDLLLYAARIGVDAQRVARQLAAGTWAKKVRDDFRGGVRSGVNGTPTFFINRLRYDGNWTDSAEFIQALTEEATPAQAAAGNRSGSGRSDSLRQTPAKILGSTVSLFSTSVIPGALRAARSASRRSA
jgi:protein-disulfide isomerase